MAFYKASLVAAVCLEQGSDRLFDSDADAAWRAYGSDLPAAVRLDLALRNLASLYPAAFAPGPVFDLPGWYDDDPWGVGFERPPRDEIEAVFRKRGSAMSDEAALAEAQRAWLVEPAAKAPSLEGLTPSTQMIIAGAAATTATALALQARPGHDVRSQVFLVAASPAPRHLLGIASALSRKQGAIRTVKPGSEVKVALADAEKLGVRPATIAVISADATAEERALLHAFADAWNIKHTFEV